MRIAGKQRVTDTYFDLVHAFPLRKLRSGAEHGEAKRIYLRLSGPKADRGTRDYLDVLGDLIAEYEVRAGLTLDTSGISAADLVHHRLEQRGMSVSALAREIGIPQPNLSAMLNGRRAWSKTAIREISRRFGIRAERFLV